MDKKIEFLTKLKDLLNEYDARFEVGVWNDPPEIELYIDGELILETDSITLIANDLEEKINELGNE